MDPKKIIAIIGAGNCDTKTYLIAKKVVKLMAKEGFNIRITEINKCPKILRVLVHIQGAVKD